MLAGGDPAGVADMAHVSDKTVWPVVAETVAAINLRFPIPTFDTADQRRLEELEAEFAARSDGVLRGCVGAVDGMAVCIRKPSSLESGGKPWQYYNRKGFYALNLQAVCDAKKKFLYGSIRCPGSTHDSTAFDVCSLGRDLDAGRMLAPFWIAGDAAYRAGVFMVVPWPGRNLEKWKDSFNFWHSNARITIECAFGILTSRWGIFWRPLNCSIVLATRIVYACMILHNMCIDAGFENERIEVMRGDGGDFAERVPTLQTGGGLWADQGQNLGGRRTDLDNCPRRTENTANLQNAGLLRPSRSTFRY